MGVSDNEDVDVNSQSNSPKPQSFSCLNLSNKKQKKIEIAAFNILNKELEESTKKMLFQIEYTNANIQPNIVWRNRKELVTEFGRSVHVKLKEFNDEFNASGKEVVPRYEVEKIEDKRWNMGTLEYKVKWKGYGSGESTWETPSNLDGCAAAIEEYEAQWEKKQNKKRKLTNANIQPNIVWKNRKDLVSEFGRSVHVKLKDFNDEFNASGKEVVPRYEVEKIEDKRWNMGTLEYKVKWKGYGSGE